MYRPVLHIREPSDVEGLCKSGVFCQACRDLADPLMRAAVGPYLGLNGTEWPCPHGKPWSWQRPLGSHLPTSPDARRRQLCTGCPHAEEWSGVALEAHDPNDPVGPIEGCELTRKPRQTTCDKRAAWRALEACPADPPRWRTLLKAEAPME
jgi:hypothetical protein